MSLTPYPFKMPTNAAHMKLLRIERMTGNGILTTATTAAAHPYAQRWQQPNNPLHWCHFSAISRASRRHKMSIQRLAPVFPPDISAGIMQNVQKVLHFT